MDLQVNTCLSISLLSKDDSEDNPWASGNYQAYFKILAKPFSFLWLNNTPLYIYIHTHTYTPHFFFHSSADGHLGCLHKHFSVYKMLSNMLSQLIFTKAGIASISILQMRIQSQAVKWASLNLKPRFYTYIYIKSSCWYSTFSYSGSKKNSLKKPAG